MRKVVLDTNIFYAADKNFSTASSILHLFFLKDFLILCIDCESKLNAEYNRECRELYQKWFEELHRRRKNPVMYASSDLNSCIRARLTSLGFHEESDQAFVGLAINTSAAIVTEDSDYGKGGSNKANANQRVLEYLESLPLRIYDYTEAVNKINSL